MIPNAEGYVKLLSDESPASDMPPAYTNGRRSGPRASTSSSYSSSTPGYELHTQMHPVSSRSFVLPPPPPATNHISIIHRDSSIRGSYKIDTSIAIPQALLDPLPSSSGPGPLSLFTGMAPQEKSRPNAYFSSCDGWVDVNLYARGGGTAVVGIENVGHATKGVKLIIAERVPGTTLSISITSSSNVTVALPADWRGLIKGGTERGKLTFSPGLQPNVATFAVDQNSPSQGRYFVGDWTDLGADEWKGDSLMLQVSHHSKQNIYLTTADEYLDSMEDAKVREMVDYRRRSKGWWSGVGTGFAACGKGFGTLCVSCFQCQHS